MAKPVRTNVSRLMARVDELTEFRLECETRECWNSLSSEEIDDPIGCASELAAIADERGWKYRFDPPGAICPECAKKGKE
jgi:hypothetical protein